ncbi:MAG: hypothetical protein ACRYFS_24915 [Janthinobacterium lividum]
MTGDEFTEVGVAGALARAYAEDTRGFLPLLAIVLTGTLPDETQVERKGGLFQKEKPIRKIAVTLGDNIYTLEDFGRGALAASRVKVVRGITLKTEPIATEDWLAELSAEISARASRNEKAFFALKNLLG